MFTPFRSRTYRHLFAAQVIALLGTGLATVALGLVAFQLAGAEAGAVLGTALAIKMVAYVGVAPIAGAFANRLPRRAMLVALDLVRAAIAICLPFVDAIWQVYALIFVLQAASAAFTPTFQATIPDVLPDEAEYTRALSLSQLAYTWRTWSAPPSLRRCLPSSASIGCSPARHSASWLRPLWSSPSDCPAPSRPSCAASPTAPHAASGSTSPRPGCVGCWRSTWPLPRPGPW